MLFLPIKTLIIDELSSIYKLYNYMVTDEHQDGTFQPYLQQMHYQFFHVPVMFGLQCSVVTTIIITTTSIITGRHILCMSLVSYFSISYF